MLCERCFCVWNVYGELFTMTPRTMTIDLKLAASIPVRMKDFVGQGANLPSSPLTPTSDEALICASIVEADRHASAAAWTLSRNRNLRAKKDVTFGTLPSEKKGRVHALQNGEPDL